MGGLIKLGTFGGGLCSNQSEVEHEAYITKIQEEFKTEAVLQAQQQYTMAQACPALDFLATELRHWLS